VFLTCLDWRRERKIKEKREKKKDYQRLNIDDVSLQATHTAKGLERTIKGLKLTLENE